MTKIVVESPATTTILEKAELFATNIAAHEFSDKIVFHNIQHVYKIIKGIGEIGKAEGLTEVQLEHTLLAGWLVHLGFKNLDQHDEPKGPAELMDLIQIESHKIAKEFLEKNNYRDADKVLEILKEAGTAVENRSLENKVLTDAVSSDFAKNKGKKRIKKLYEQFLLTTKLKQDKTGWYQTSIDYLMNHQYHTQYGKDVLEIAKTNLIKSLQKDLKELSKNQDLAIKKQLDISDEELKKLKKNLQSVKGRDEKGIQTMFRTTSRNHYTLNQMTDRKSNIMISINAILLSLIVGRVLGGGIETFCIHYAPIIVLLIGCTISIFYAISAIVPNRNQGEFTEDQVRNKQGNLLYFGNFHNMSYRDYEWGMLEMINDGDFLYTTMIRDIYFLGQVLAKKSNLIRISLHVFIGGFIICIISFIILGMMGDLHFQTGGHG